MSDEKGFWRHPLVVGVVGPLAGAGVLAIAHYAGITVANAFAWLIATGNFLAEDITITRWKFLSWGALTLGLLLATIWQIGVDRSQKSNQKSETPKADGSNSIQPSQAYVTDVFFGFRWRWNLSKTTGEMLEAKMYCPRCDHELLKSNFEAIAYRDYQCICDNCRYNGYLAEYSSPRAMFIDVKRAVERKIRTEEWRQAVNPEKPSGKGTPKH